MLRDKSRAGFTLVEIIVVIAITSVMLGILLPTYLSVGRIYRETADANLTMTKAAHAIDFLRDSVQPATGLKIIQGEPDPESGNLAIWCKGNKLYYRKDGVDTAIYMEDTDFELTFGGDGRLLKIELRVLGGGKPYTIESAVALTGVREIPGGAGTGIEFKTY